MKSYNPPHAAQDKAKVTAMVEAIIAGSDLPAIVVNGETALTGSHRIAAYLKAERDERLDRDLTIPTVEVSNGDLKRALLACDAKYTSDTEHNVLCYALCALTADDDVRAALADQTHGDSIPSANVARVAALTEDEVNEEWESL